MSTARVSARAVKALASTSKTTTRSLSMTGPATFSSLLTSDKPSSGRSNAPRLPESAAIPVPDTNDTGKPIRHFNTSRSLKTVKDSSTIDFTYIPEFDPDMVTSTSDFFVPILPGQEPSWSVKQRYTEAETPVLIPTIFTVADDSTHIHAPSAMYEVTSSNHIDFQGLASGVASSVKSKLRNPIKREGMTKQIWNDLLDDLIGAAQPSHAKA